MALNGLLVADSDMHVMEPADLWQRYMDPAWEHAAPVGMTEIERDMRVKVKNSVLLQLGRMRPRQQGRPWKDSQDSVYLHAEERGWDPKSQVRAMEIEHLDSAVLFQPALDVEVIVLFRPKHAGQGLPHDHALVVA